MSQEYMIDMYASPEKLKSQVDHLWNVIYTREMITEIHADDDGKIFYTVRSNESK